jgi:hypothetical protein
MLLQYYNRQQAGAFTSTISSLQYLYSTVPYRIILRIMLCTRNGNGILYYTAYGLQYGLRRYWYGYCANINTVPFRTTR